MGRLEEIELNRDNVVDGNYVLIREYFDCPLPWSDQMMIHCGTIVKIHTACDNKDFYVQRLNHRLRDTWIFNYQNIEKIYKYTED